MLKAMLLSAFFGYMSVGEFTAHSKCCIQDSILSISDLQFCNMTTVEASVLISFRGVKTNPVGPAQLIRLTRSLDATWCPVTALQEYVAIRPHSQPLFCHFDGSPLKRSYMDHW